MRPRKVVLIVCDVDSIISHFRFVLPTQLHCMSITANSANEALTYLSECHFDLMIIFPPVSNMNKLLTRAKLGDDHMPRMVVTKNKPDYDQANSDCTLWNPPMNELLERIKVMAARKRGPRKGFKKPPVSEGTFVLPVEVTA